MKGFLPDFQKYYWLHWKLHPESAAYNIPYEFELHFDLDLSKFSDALRNFVDQIHPLCKASFFEKEGGLCFEIGEHHTLNLTVDPKLVETNNLSEKTNFFTNLLI